MEEVFGVSIANYHLTMTRVVLLPVAQLDCLKKIGFSPTNWDLKNCLLLAIRFSLALQGS